MNNFDTSIESKKLGLIDFFATWYSSFKTQSPILKQIKDRLGEWVTILKVYVDKKQQIYNHY
ncbi:thioredoxin family protein [Flavobacterium luteum]|uniref:thioredoxin family protein n=1 Tax=Flavobacterium luteum TaxID=2026654 RepID=UPI001CD9CF0B|nr:thioredoxin domain-containing protein [Flavobacterium luteum]